MKEKILIASDLHGSSYYCEELLRVWDLEIPNKVVLLGDILYHGPRNDLPKEYAPKKVISMLNERKNQLLCVRGNCDTEVDQMVLEFPILADYGILFLNGRMVYITHGHKFNLENLPPMNQGDILLHGHTHVLACEQKDGIVYLNPGSTSIPKENNPPTYLIYEDGEFLWKDFDQNILKRFSI